MVRFKNRWFLVEFLFPSSQPVPSRSSTPSSSDSPAIPLSTAPESSYLPPPPSKKKKKSKERPSSTSGAGPSSSSKPPSPSSSDDDDDGSSEDSDEDPNDSEPHWPILGPLPLLLPPPPNPISGKQKKLDERSIYHALKSSVVQAFGDDGWGRVGGNTSVKYYSSNTSLCIIRTSRDHHRTVWAALSMLGAVNGEKVVARVVHCSGTIKKIQLATITYNRTIVSTILDSLSSVPAPRSGTSTPTASKGPAGSKKRPLDDTDGDGDGEAVKLVTPEGEGGWKGWEEREKKVVEGLTD
ncbi:Rpp14/Pop5 family-domain-containing protein [Mrakia frigida]|uniref:RNA-binding protein POP5 n=1 Tax=Mrakia frigida TaxID=29902 RepID=UPI003FCBF1D5